MSIETVNPNQHRVIALIDMDCFYVQVEELSAIEFRGQPCGGIWNLNLHNIYSLFKVCNKI